MPLKTWLPRALAGLLLTAAGTASAQYGHMMNDGDRGMWGGAWMGGYGGYWGPILLAAVVGLVVWAVMRKRK